jgi:DNA-binding MarR family transcriptional regulator
MDGVPSGFEELWFLIRRVNGLSERAGDVMCRSELGISLAQFLVLSVVDAFPGRLNQQAVADRLGLTKGTVSRQIERSVDAGLLTVAGSPDSRREKLVALTEAGTALVRRGDGVFEGTSAIATGRIAAADLRTTIRVLHELNEALDETALSSR